MTEKEKRLQRARTEDAVFNRMLIWLAAAVIAEAIVLFVKRYYINFPSDSVGMAMAIGQFFSVFVYIGLVLIVIGVIWCVLAWKKKKSLIVPAVCTAVVVFLWLLSVTAYFLNENGVKVMAFLPIAAIVLILIYFLYHRAFLVNSIVTACGMLALWGVRHFSRPKIVVVFVIGWVGLLVIAAVAWVLKRNNGRIGKLQLVNDSKCYFALFLSCAVVFVLTLLGLILGTSVAYYLLYALIGWLFCLAVYYTVKLM